MRISQSRHWRKIANDFAHALLARLDPTSPGGCQASVEGDVMRATLVVDHQWERVEEVAEGRMPFRHTVTGYATLYVASLRLWRHRRSEPFVRERMQLGWQPEDLARAIYEGVDELRTIEALSARREEVFDEMRARELPEQLPDRLEEHSSRFDQMTLEDCEFWMKWLHQQPLQGFKYKAPPPWQPAAD